MNYIFDSMKEYKTGLSLYYPLIYSIVVGLETKSAFEFGAGWSTRVILDALKETGGHLYSISTDSQRDVMIKNETHEDLNYIEHWTHAEGQSQDILKHLRNQNIKEPFDFVLHDGSHTAEVVYEDLKFIMPEMKYNGVLLVHDVLHSQCGQGMRYAVGKALNEEYFGLEHEIVTLPYGFGLSIIVIKEDRNKKDNGTVKITKHKPTSVFTTEVI